jgi:CRISPR-associated protein Cas1
MTDRIIDLAEGPARLRIENGILLIEAKEGAREGIPCEEIAAVVVSNREVVYTQAVLGALAEAGAMFVTCDAKRMPTAMLLPLKAHHAQAERYRKQAALTAPERKRLWAAIVKAKIRAQAAVLEGETGEDHGLRALVGQVRSGDVSNVEARAARRYWGRLFVGGGASEPFGRWNEEDGRVHCLNYGYAVLRALTARALCGAGLHPSFALKHTNVHNAFGLADDVMEVFRPKVDRAVRRMAEAVGGAELDREAKRALAETLTGRVEVEGESRTVPDVVQRMAQSLAGVVMGAGKAMWLPEWKEGE